MDKRTNSSIQCSVENCAHHGPGNCCCLSQIKVGTCGCTPTNTCDGTECCSFAPGGETR